MSPRQIEVQIMGQSYILGCPEGGEARLQAAVGRVDAAMCKIRDAGKIKARDRIAVLAALNIAYDQPEAPVPAPAAPAGVAPSSTTHGQFDDLLQRLDQALGRDGQLL